MSTSIRKRGMFRLAVIVAGFAAAAYGQIDTAEVWRFDGERCARVLARVMADLDDRGV